MGEKFDRTGGIGNVTDYLIDPAGTVSYGITTFSNGTPDIQPEKATTMTFGGVYRPAWAEGLSVSLDRSEERRVGKEWRAREAAFHYKDEATVRRAAEARSNTSS